MVKMGFSLKGEEEEPSTEKLSYHNIFSVQENTRTEEVNIIPTVNIGVFQREGNERSLGGERDWRLMIEVGET